MTPITQTFQYGKHTVRMETGHMARQADGAVFIDVDGTSLLVTVCAVKKADPARDFFPLMVVYQEKMYAAGKIPGGYIKREGRPSDFETLTARLMDRPIRPLFPEGFNNEVQIVATVVSLNPDVTPDIPAMIGASAALAISGVPFNGPLAAARVGYKDGDYILNPSEKELESSELDLVIAGTDTSVLMVESEAKVLSEEIMLGGVMAGFEAMQVAIEAVRELAQKAAKPAWDWQAPAKNQELVAAIEPYTDSIAKAYDHKVKAERYAALGVVRDEIQQKLGEQFDEKMIGSYIHDVEKNLVRERILSGELRIDGRDTETVRSIHAKTGLLSRTHGSSLFTRGETQALVVATIGTGSDAQTYDLVGGERKEHFMLQYNFPPYSVGECGMIGSPKRREIGHGRLARRGIAAVLPTQEEFPYAMRVVSEITESNGSSSMASVCGTSLALMDAGVPIKAPVAGIAMGLVKDGGRFAVLTDILGDEDHLGDMDFKVAGTAEGVTALQMDIKIDGITPEIMQIALAQAKDARMHILGIMNQAISSPRQELSEFAPRMVSFAINPEKIRDVIGKGGAVIKGLTEEFDASIEISDEGRISIVAPDETSLKGLKERIELITAELEVGRIYQGKVARIMDFGAFVTIGNKDGLVHISQISDERVEKVDDHLAIGQEVTVKVLEIDRQGRVRLSMKEAVEKPAEETQTEPSSDE